MRSNLKADTAEKRWVKSNIAITDNPKSIYPFSQLNLKMDIISSSETPVLFASPPNNIKERKIY